MKKINIKDMPVDEWVELRKSSIGASDSGSILGLLPDSFGHNNVDTYLEKTGQAEGFEGNIATELGLELEPYIMRKFTEKTGLKARKDNFMRYHPDIPYLSANLDGIVVGENVPVEFKTMGEWSGDIPAYYYTQLQHQMAVFGSSYIYYVALVLGWNKQVIVERYERDDDLIHNMFGEYDKFWNGHVLPKVAPEAITLADAGKLYPNDNGEEAEATPEIIELARTTYQLQQVMKSQDKAIKVMKGSIGEFMKPSAILVQDGLTLATWKKSKDGTKFDMEAFQADNPEMHKKYLIHKEGSRRMLIKPPIESEE
jgi:putative phage-type endonuclease